MTALSFLMILHSSSDSNAKAHCDFDLLHYTNILTHVVTQKVHKFLALYFHYFVFCDWPFLHGCILRGNLLFSAFVLGSAFGDYDVFTGKLC